MVVDFEQERNARHNLGHRSNVVDGFGRNGGLAVDGSVALMQYHLPVASNEHLASGVSLGIKASLHHAGNLNF